MSRAILRSGLWLGFYALILWAWWMMFTMSRDMDLDWIGRPGPMGQAMAAMDPRMDMYMPMAEFGPLFWMWGIMMAAMMLLKSCAIPLAKVPSASIFWDCTN